MKKRLLRAFMAAALIVAMAVTGSVVASAAFKDVTEYEEAIDTLNELGIIRGHSSTIFAPKDDIKRVHMALLISKLCTGKVETSVWQEAIDAKTFSDISNDPGKNHYPTAILYAVNNGIIKGMGDGTFAPDANIQVDQACAMIVRCLNYPSTSLDKGDWSANYMQKADELGLFEGVDELKYSPTKVVNRGQVAQMLFNALHAPIYGNSNGQTYAQKNFNISSGTKMVLVATSKQSLVAGVQKTSLPNYVVMAELNPDGTYGAKHTLKASDLGINQSYADSELGSAYVIQCEKTTGATEKVVSYKKVAAMETIRDGVTFATTKNTMTYDGVTYSLVSDYDYDLVDGKAPSKRQVIVYCGNLSNTIPTTATSYYSVITRASDLANKGLYEIKPFDDNGDGYIDRAIFTPYTVGQYKKTETKVTVTVAGSAVIDRAPSVIGVTAPSGQTLKSGDFVLFFYNPQTMTLEISSIFPTQKGTVSGSYSAVTGTVTIRPQGSYYDMTYGVGHSNMTGATSADVLKVAQNMLVQGQEITYAYMTVDGTNYIVAVDAGSGEMMYESQYQTVVVKDIHAAENTKDYITANGIKLTVYTVGVATEQVIHVSSYMQNSTTNSYMSAQQIALSLTANGVADYVKVGDILELPLMNIGQAGYAINITGKPAFSATQTNIAWLSYTAPTTYMGMGSLTLNRYSTTVQGKAWNTDSETVVVVMQADGTVAAAALSTVPNISLSAGQSFYISYGGGTASTYYKPVKMIYIRPTPVGTSTTPGVNVNAFDTVVYLDMTTQPTFTPSGTGWVFSYTGLNVMSGQSVTVTYTATGTASVQPTAAGFYKVNGTTIVDPTPISGDVTGTNMRIMGITGGVTITAQNYGTGKMYYLAKAIDASYLGVTSGIRVYGMYTAGTQRTMTNLWDTTTDSYNSNYYLGSFNASTSCMMITSLTSGAVTVIYIK